MMKIKRQVVVRRPTPVIHSPSQLHQPLIHEERGSMGHHDEVTHRLAVTHEVFRKNLGKNTQNNILLLNKTTINRAKSNNVLRNRWK